MWRSAAAFDARDVQTSEPLAERREDDIRCSPADDGLAPHGGQTSHRHPGLGANPGLRCIAAAPNLVTDLPLSCRTHSPVYRQLGKDRWRKQSPDGPHAPSRSQSLSATHCFAQGRRHCRVGARENIAWSICPAGDWDSAPSAARRSAALAATILRNRDPPSSTRPHQCATGPLASRRLATGTKSVCHLGFPPAPGELERAFVAGPDVVIGCYRGQATEHAPVISHLKPRCRVIGIPNGVDIEAFAITPPAPEVLNIRRRWRLAVAILGHISEVKGYGAFIEAAGRLAAAHPDCGFVAIGAETTEPGARNRFEAASQRARSRRSLCFSGLPV